jgi:predicted NAD-dependent protein-ADP-ribosyltransferase YbiA (DUF1768 family)
MIPEVRARKLAAIMSDVLKETVWPKVLFIAEQTDLEPHGPLRIKVGTGKRTYHTVKTDEATNKKYHQIVFGKKMVLDKFSKTKAGNWLSGSEILHKGYFEGVLSLPNLLAHTILHEAAHGLQVMAGDRVRGEVHTEIFYSWLDILSNACAEQCLDELRKKASAKKIELEFDSSLDDIETPLSSEDLAIGDKVIVIDRHGERLAAEITKINKKTVTVKAKGEVIIRAPYAFLRPYDESVDNGLSSSSRGEKPPQSKAHTPASETGEFLGKYYFLSSEFTSPIQYKGRVFQTAKHLYFWLLSLKLANPWLSEQIHNAATIARLDSIITNATPEFSGIDEEVRIKALKRTLWEKFANGALQRKLIESYGIELTHHEKEIHNDLGKQLMALREYLVSNVQEKAG